MRESKIKRILAFPPLSSGHPDRRLIADLLFEIVDRVTKLERHDDAPPVAVTAVDLRQGEGRA